MPWDPRAQRNVDDVAGVHVRANGDDGVQHSKRVVLIGLLDGSNNTARRTAGAEQTSRVTVIIHASCLDTYCLLQVPTYCLLQVPKTRPGGPSKAAK